MLSDAEVSCLSLLGSVDIDDKLKRSIILYCPTSVLKRVVQVVRDVVFGLISISEEETSRLRQQRARIHRLAAVERSEQQKRRTLAQKGSLPALTAVINAALPALSSELAAKNDESSNATE